MRIFFNTLLFLPFFSISQPNCNAYLYYGDSLQFKACKLVENIDAKYYQFTREFQEAYDEALEICPYFAYGYREKSVAYLKSGDFLTWKKLIDKAVAYDEKGNLGYRGWCRYQFFRDYKGAIEDIERLDSLANYDIGYAINGDYHLEIARALCYSELGDTYKAIDIIKAKLGDREYGAGLYDYYQLGVMYFQVNDYTNALRCFKEQVKINNIAEPHFYLSKIFELSGDFKNSEDEKIIFENLNNAGRHLSDPYTHHANAIFEH